MIGDPLDRCALGGCGLVFREHHTGLERDGHVFVPPLTLPPVDLAPPPRPIGTIRVARSGSRLILMRDATVLIDDLERVAKLLPRALELLREYGRNGNEGGGCIECAYWNDHRPDCALGALLAEIDAQG